MATPPKCKLCGASHWSGQPHVYADQPKVTAKALKKAEPAPSIPITESDALAAYLAAERAHKAAYMREYRARKKEK